MLKNLRVFIITLLFAQALLPRAAFAFGFFSNPDISHSSFSFSFDLSVPTQRFGSPTTSWLPPSTPAPRLEHSPEMAPVRIVIARVENFNRRQHQPPTPPTDCGESPPPARRQPEKPPEKNKPEARPLKPLSLSEVAGDNEGSCKGIPKNIRALFFSHFQQKMSEGTPMTEADVIRFSTRLGRVMTVKAPNGKWLGETNGDTTNVNHCYKPNPNSSSVCHDNQLTLRSSRGSKNSSAVANARKHLWLDPSAKHPLAMSTLGRYENAMFGLESIGVRYNKTTDWGLTQLSYDRLHQTKPSIWSHITESISKATKAIAQTVTFGLMKPPKSSSRGNRDSVASRTLAHFRDYQAIARESSSKAVEACGSQFVFEEGMQAGGASKIAAKFEEIKSCQVCKGDVCGTNPSKEELACWGNWMSLCPNLNLDVAFDSEDGYFGTRSMDRYVYGSDGKFTGRTDGPKVGRCHQTFMGMLKAKGKV